MLINNEITEQPFFLLGLHKSIIDKIIPSQKVIAKIEKNKRQNA